MASCNGPEISYILDSMPRFSPSPANQDITMGKDATALRSERRNNRFELESVLSAAGPLDTADFSSLEKHSRASRLNSDEIEGSLRRSDSSSSISSFLSDFSIRTSDSYFSAEGTADKEREELRRVFDAFDKNLDGKISQEELLHTMSQLGFEISENDISSMISGIDENGDGFLDFEEFISVNHALNTKSYDGAACESGQDTEDEADEADLFEAFRVFDKNSDGYISAGELQSVLSNLGLYVDAKLKDYENMIRAVDVNGDGQVDFSEFKAMMMSGSFCNA